MNWTSSDSATLRDYLQKTNFKLKQYLQSRIPTCDGKTIEEVALQAKYKEGFEKLIKEIDDLVAQKQNDDDASNGGFTSM